jgi:hypothetical protein
MGVLRIKSPICVMFIMNEESIMKKLLVLIVLFVTGLLNSNNAFAGMSEVTWKDSDKYTDLRPGNEHRQHFKNRIFGAFEKHFLKLSEQLPEGQLLKIEVTNVDLAGDVRFDTMVRIRVIKDLYIPRMKFTYKVINADKSVAQEGDVDLKDMGFMSGSSLRYKHKPIPYEKRMLDKWFKATFIQQTK